MTRAVVLFVSVVTCIPAADDNSAIFNAEIVPILRAKCISCHQGTQAQADLSVTTLEAVLKGGKRGPALTPGSADGSLLVQYLRGEKQPRMPLGGELPEASINQIAAAIDRMKPPTATAPERDERLEWLLKVPKAPAIPSVQNTAWVANPIDAFILARLEGKGLAPAPAADKHVLLRRLYFDLLGVPPTVEEARSFLEDNRPDAWQRLVDKLLADPRYGVRWARHWLDLARYAESDGFAVDMERPTAWRYRDYVIRAFNNDKPYDQFVKEQIAGDELRGGEEQDRWERLVALGFLRMATWEIDATSKQQLRQDFLNEITGTTASVFLGLTAGCAQCHNHKYDPIPQRDFYRLQAFFAATGIDEIPAPFIDAEDPEEMRRLYRKYEDEAVAAKQELKRREEALKQRFMESKGLKPEDEAVKEFMRELRVANAFFQEREDAIFREQVWRDYLDAKDRLQHLTELQRRYRPVAYSVTDIVPPNVPALPDTFVLHSGELEAKGDKVEPGFFECVTGNAEAARIPFSGGSSGRRLALAEWIASDKNPLTARVMVNRIWEKHFGQGLVRTPSDFGKNGARPSHPDLLDWLATQFIEKKWSIKQMHRLLLTSNAYRMSTEHPEAKRYGDIDAENELLWRRNWKRRDAEVIRDSLLSISGLLNPKQGGPGVLLDAPADVAEGFEFFKWFPSTEEEQRRRSIFTFQRRSVVNPMLETFDVANMNASCARRNATTVAPQALTLMNGDLSNKASSSLADRVIENAGPAEDKQIRQTFWLALSRDPSDTELRKSRELLARFPGRDGLQHLGLVLFNTNEFLYQE
jgi:hypothetical protein